MKFLSPKGAVKDAKELEYLVALHQTTHAEIEEFRDGSIDDEDVRVFLMSRFGIVVTNEQVREYIFKGLAGGDGEDEAIDILELVSILMIPMLVKVSDSVLGNKKRTSILTSDQERLLPPPTIIADVLQNILSDTTDGESSTAKPPPLTPSILRQIFVQYDELELVKDDKLIEEMIAVACRGRPGAPLDVKAFARALSSDVNLYNPENETRYTEILTDIFPNGVEKAEESGAEKAAETDVVGDSTQSVKKVKTLSHMDFTADTFVHSLHVSMLWLVIVFSYFFYMLGVQGADFLQSSKDGFGYKVGYAVLRWTITMLKLVILGGAFGFCLGLGNGLPLKSIIGPLLGLIATAVLVFVPASYKGSNEIFDTDLENSDEHSEWPGLGYLLVIFGIVLVLLQVKNIFDLMMPSFEHTKLYTIVDRVAGSSTQLSYRSKQAGIFKINQLVKNAYELHKLDEKAQERSLLKSSRPGEGSNDSPTIHKSSKAIALRNYADQVDELEEVGGFVWSVKEYFSGRLAGTEGIWLPSRLLAANAIQFFAIINSQMRGFYAGIGVCRDVSFEGPECYDLFEPLNSTEGLDGLIGDTCTSLQSAFTAVEAQVTDTLLGANCSVVLSAARDFANEAAIDENIDPAEIENIINRCYGVNTMTAEDIEKFNEWFDDDEFFPDITNETLSYCSEVADFIKTDAFTDLAPGFEDDAFQAYRLCMEAYGSIEMESPCDTQLFSPLQEIFAYEKDYDGENFCVSFISACYIDPFNPTRATCIIGESEDMVYQFQGSTCETYPQINNTMKYYEENILPQQLSVMRFFPEKWTLYLTAIMSIVSGSIVAIITAGVYIPSAIHTVLKFRYGVIPSLKDPKFLKYRDNLVNQTYMIGAMFWGLIVTTLMVTILIALIVFLLVWPASRDIVINLCAQVLGIAVTIILRSVLCMIFLKTAYAGFYRKMPAFANAFMFCMECWNIALTAAFVLGRLVKFLLATGLYVGRIDRPVLAEGLALDIDSLPRIFRQNLLSAEAHRHPYIEQLAQMYLMKLRHKDDFGTKAGSIWRLLFVSALMPWLRKKRIQDDVDIGKEIVAKMRSSIAQGEPEKNPRRISRASFLIDP
ncbi:unnamed protein product [Cylindrotheca closterium]|uniref:Uncharacterized protein n=1 Tax=Cylindrotheca closterium TaxID=2856 RepID=A0AAD2CNS7_9STRA|nr:unnamed protein product [Cylindrotheca closterium]